MTYMRRVRPVETYMGRLRKGTDLLEEITGICRQYDIRLGRIEAIGAVETARIIYYNQQKQVYEYLTIDRGLEITKLSGNVSLKDGQVFVHAHVTLSDDSGAAYGGHLAPGTVVFACECIVEAFEGGALEREPDPQTGLALWKATE